MTATPAAAEFGARHGDDLYACLAQLGVGVGVAVVSDDDAGSSATTLLPSSHCSRSAT